MRKVKRRNSYYFSWSMGSRIFIKEKEDKIPQIDCIETLTWKLTIFPTKKQYVESQGKK
jgi:hypothetical protein